MNTEKKTGSSSSDSSGEKMLTEERLAKIRWDAEVVGDHYPASTLLLASNIVDLLDHIAALSTTIKRLETPVADGEVLKAIHWLECGGPSLIEISDLLRRQARKIYIQREPTKAMIDAAIESWREENQGRRNYEVAWRAMYDAALSLNSVETREMKP